MNPNKEITKIIGLLFTTILSILLILNILNLRLNYGSPLQTSNYISFGFFIFFISLSLFSTYSPPKIGMWIQFIILVLQGSITIIDSDEARSLMGEMILVIAIFYGWRYSFIENNKGKKFISILIYMIGLKFISAILRGNHLFNDGYISASLGSVALLTILFAIFFAEEKNIFTLSKKLCEKFTDENFFNMLGHNFYENFIHDYNVDEGIMLSQLIKEALAEEDYNEVDELLNSLLATQVADSKKVHSIKDSIRSIQQKEKKNIYLNEYISCNWRLLVGFNKTNGSEIILKFDKDDILISIAHLDINTILRNLLSNSFDATDATNRKITIETFKSRNKGKMIISDNGQGISFSKNGIVPHNHFLPGLTTKKTGTGYGMISVIKKVKDNNWKIQIQNMIGEGCKYILTFPITENN